MVVRRFQGLASLDQPDPGEMVTFQHERDARVDAVVHLDARPRPEAEHPDALAPVGLHLPAVEARPQHRAHRGQVAQQGGARAGQADERRQRCALVPAGQRRDDE